MTPTTTKWPSTSTSDHSLLQRGRIIALLLAMIVVTATLLLFLLRQENSGSTGNPVTLAPDQVLEHTDPALKTAEVDSLRQQWLAQPHNGAIATALAQQYIEQGRRTFDPRLWGYAQAALQPWWTQPEVPDDMLLARATLLQHAHDFAAAERDLHSLVARNPRHAQAHLTRAVVLNVQGKFAQAKQDCYALTLLAPPLTAVSCLAHVTQLTAPSKALSLLQKTLASTTLSAGTASLAWAQTLAAEIASREQQVALADHYFETAKALTPDDHYLLGAYADHLLSQHRWRAVVTLLTPYSKANNLLVRLAWAEKALKNATWKIHAQQLSDEFETERRRNDNFHWREFALYQLKIADNAGVAAEAAQRNWAEQREAIDLKLLISACEAAGDASCLAMAQQWQTENHIKCCNIGASL